MSLETKKIEREKDIELDLQLGDVIYITNKVNENLNEQTFIIDYIDNSKVYLINTNTLDRIKIKISEDGILGDGHITKIEILSRADSPSYARQNGLLPGKWINIYFDGDFPVIITGEITNLEEDMIEIKTNDKDVIYINFDYKGIPEDLPIENIEIRLKPTTQIKRKIEEGDKLEQGELEQGELEQGELEQGELEQGKLEQGELEELNENKPVIETEQLQFMVPVKDVKDQLREIILKADQIVFGDEELGPIGQFVDVSTKLQRHSIETQVTDLLDDLLSTIPNTQRTPRVLNNIHIMIERFKQLREQFSEFDQYGNVDGVIVRTALYRPLKKWLNKFNHNLYWILPVVKNIKKVYNVENVDEDNNDIINLKIDQNVYDMNELIENYKSTDLPPESNKYSALYSDLAPYFRPFEYLNDEDNRDIIVEKEVLENINVVIDNLENFYSSVFANNMIRNRRFVISKYTLGDTKLDITNMTSSKMTSVRVKMTQNDVMAIKSIMTLPEPTIRFSKINLPGTDILTRANLNEIFVNYWQLLKKTTNVADIFVESLDTEFEFNEKDFVSGIRNYVVNMPAEETRGITKKDLYSQFVNTIVPKTRILFNLMKKYITGKLSIVDVVGYLEPFLIYVDDLTFTQYGEIVAFIDAKISIYNKNIIEFSRIFKIIASIKQNPVKPFTIISIINAKEEIFNTGYQLDNPETTFTNSEILRKLILKDYSRLYTAEIAKENLKLMFPKDVSDLFDVEKKTNETKLKEENKDDKCDTVTIAKMYTSLDQLEYDNNHLIYFDKKYDKTNYGIMEGHDKNGYADKVLSLTPEQLKNEIVFDQIKKYRLSESDANYLAETLIDGNKKVIDGQYAILYKGYAENILDESDYYVRKNNKWVLDKELSGKIATTYESSIICDLKEKCISIPTTNDDTCESMKTAELNLQNSLLQNILSEFDTKYKISKEEFQKEINEKFDYFLSIMPILSKLETNFLLKYNNQKYKLGSNIDDQDKNQIVSPFSQILDIILSQKDFVKKQNDIIKFSDKFTRPGTIGFSNPESQHWLYCIKTNVPLIPAFKKELAAAFITSQYTYQIVLERIKATIGQLSDDGDWWTDKNTGWPICPGDFDVEEGYEEGFKVSSRSIMEDDAGSRILSGTTEKTIKYITPESIMINNIVNALSISMGINIESQKDFIINSVIETIKTTVESESYYKEHIKIAAQKGKNIPSYKDFFNTSLLYYTLGMFLIALQTCIPSVKTRKTHPGCVRSFIGYPFDGQGDYNSVAYLACITYDIRSSSEPWNVLKKTNSEKIQAKIKAVIDSSLIQLPEVQRKFTEKTQYLLTNPSTSIGEEHDISKWTDFLPPLVPFKIKHLANISEDFKKSLVSDLKIGSERQREKILVIESKIIQFSLAIQEKIQHIVKNHKVILHTANNEPYLENACCDSKENETVVDYFISRDNDIFEYNKIVEKLSNILDDVRSNTESAIFYSNINTKNVYPPISNIFNEKTIYLAFIFYCKFKSLVPIPNDLLPICTNKPEHNLLNTSDTIDRIIQKLKEDGRNYTNAQFLRLIQLIGRENIVKIDFDNPVISCIAKLSKLLEAIYDENNEDEIVEQSLRDLIRDAIDTFNIASENYSPQVTNLNNFLLRTNEEMRQHIIDFVQRNSGSRVTRNSIKKFIKTITNLSIWIDDDNSITKTVESTKISNDTMYNVTNFYKTFISNFAIIFPNIILNKVNYDDTHIPNYYGFSKRHANKLKTLIADYFEKLKPFYGVPSILKILTTMKKLGKNIIKIAESTPCFSSIKNEDKILKGIIDERTSRFLFEYYLLRIIVSYIDLSDEEAMIVTEINKPMDVTDLFSVEYIDETETRVDLGVTSQNIVDKTILTGNKKQLKETICEMLIAFVNILSIEKDIVDTSYEEIQDRIFKLKEREKNMVTDKLKGMSDEGRDIDTVLKITKQGLYSKGLQKGLTMYDKDFYERTEEQELRDEMEKAERKIRNNKDVGDENIDILLDEYLEQRQNDVDIDEDAFDMRHLGEGYTDGNYDGVEAPEEEYEDYQQED
jgi:hypothetical protein